MNMTDYDYHEEHKEETMQAGMDQLNARWVLGVRSHASTRFLGIPYQMSVKARAHPSGHLPDPHAPLVAAIVVFHRRIKRGNL